MKILAVEKQVVGIKNEDYFPHLKAEALKVWELYQEGVIRELYFTNDGSEQNYAVLILECKDAKEARKYIDTLPLVKEGLIDFEILPLVPYPGFKRLFEKP